MAQVPDLATFRELIAQLDHSIGYPGAAVEGSRGRAGSPKQPHLPDGWLDSRILGTLSVWAWRRLSWIFPAAKHLYLCAAACCLRVAAHPL